MSPFLKILLIRIMRKEAEGSLCIYSLLSNINVIEGLVFLNIITGEPRSGATHRFSGGFSVDSCSGHG